MVHTVTLCLFVFGCLVATSLAVTPSCEANFGDHIICTSWLFNDETTSTYFGSLEDVQDAEYQQMNGFDYLTITTNGIPKYDYEVTQELIDDLNARPLAHRDFINGETTISVGEVIEFGQDIGYDGNCELNYWPPGPVCPVSATHTFTFPMDPSPAAEECYTTVGAIGKWINGVSVFNWWDTSSYDGLNEWHILANMGELLDLDICFGHAANSGYHHHGHPNCIQNRIGDDGSAQSPVYGFAADGYPILGPYVSEGVLAQSCWLKRDYDDPSSPTGCGVAGARTCVLVDMYDLSQGFVDTASAGPNTSDTITTMSRNTFPAESGYFFEDYYYDPDCTTQGDEYLDEHNGRFNAELNTYTYHVTIDLSDGLENVFPHVVGPTFYGVVDDNTMVGCTTDLFADSGAGGGGTPPDGGPGMTPVVETPVVETPETVNVTPVVTVETPAETDVTPVVTETFSFQTNSGSPSGSSSTSFSNSFSASSNSGASSNFSFDDDDSEDDDNSSASMITVSAATLFGALAILIL